MQGRGRTLLRTSLGALGLLIVCSLLVFVVASRTRPVYQVWLNGRLVGGGNTLDPLLAAATALWERDRQQSVILESGGRQWAFRLADLGMGGPARPVREAALDLVKPYTFWVRLRSNQVPVHLNLLPAWDRERLGQALAPVEAAVQREPVPARLVLQNHQPVIIPEQAGVAVDREALVARLEAGNLPSRIPLPLAQRQPSETRQSLEAMRIRTLLAEYSTRFDPTVPRAHNVAKAAAAFNGLILKPGQILSANATIGPVNLANGWKEAPVIENGALVPGVGGGVCQVATTLYGAAIRANLEVIERHPHQLLVSYVQPSQDAAIAQGWEDLKLRNTTLGHLLIETESEGGVLTFRLYGDQPAGLQVQIESHVTGTTPYTTRTVEDSGLLPGEKERKSGGIPGTLSEAYRLIFRNGTLIRRELLSRDSYLPVAEVILIGPRPVEESGDEG